MVVKNLGANRGMQEQTLNTGMHWWDPLVFDVITYDTRLKMYALEDVPSNTLDGQPVMVDVSFEIGLIDKGVPTLHENVGTRYFQQVILPLGRASLRNHTSTALSDEIYTGSGRVKIQSQIAFELQGRLRPQGIRIEVNLRDIEFQNLDFVATLERKAQAAQEKVIQERLAEAAAQEAIKVKNKAEGAKFKVIQEAEAEREKLKLTGEGQRLQKQENAIGILAVATAEAEGMRLKRLALAGRGGEELVSIAWAENLGPNVKVYGVPTGAPGTSTFLFDSALRGVGRAAAAAAAVSERKWDENLASNLP